MRKIFCSNSQTAYMALLKVAGVKDISIPANAPSWFATVPEFLGIRIKLEDVKIDFSSKSDIQNLFFESFIPNDALFVFQNRGAIIGEAKAHIVDFGDFAAIFTRDETLAKELEIFVKGGIEKGRLWNFDIKKAGIDIEAENVDIPDIEEKLEKQKEVLERFEKEFAKTPYFDILHIGNRTLKEFYPIFLKPSLYCPKEDIVRKLVEKGFEATVHYKPLYKLTLFNSKPLPVSEELYKSELSIPLCEEVIESLFETVEEYSYRSCSF
ncbi:DegT/DnrJ/EryC1/StrS family aminotransferase [Nitrosophilus alvini]|uniref:DegT/DnrJ/EryC1/StrS family aminotransferase n=1 Tax=Nitrosophilus alvini TaxID=2714855 RepID=UPI00190DDBCD|nr:DegT/DnrJ/EryC1/StrS family aminotransferase [Nitrosophilus alvini]